MAWQRKQAYKSWIREWPMYGWINYHKEIRTELKMFALRHDFNNNVLLDELNVALYVHKS
jgi:hypothetical protein